MKIGLVGYPGSGKTTVFSALTGLEVETGYGGAKGHLGSVKVPDPRVDALADLYTPKKVTYAEINFTDLAGGHEGLDRAVLNQMRPLEALCQVVRAFPDDARGAPDALAEIEGLRTETILADLEVIENRVTRLRKDRSAPGELALLERLQGELEAERALRDLELSAEEERVISGFTFLSQKPLLLVLNVEEEQLGEGVPAVVEAAAAENHLGLVLLSAQVEMDIAQMEADDQSVFLDSLGLAEPASHRFIRAAYTLCDLIAMLTVGPDECRSWPVARGTAAPKAAGKIHSDIERGFIRAEVIPYDDLISLGSESKCRDAGKLRVEGKNYVVEDGNVVNFRFNV